MEISPQVYDSPDGQLRFLVVVDSDGDVALGFDGHSWHTHADIQAELGNATEPDAVRQSVDDLLGDRSVIALLSVRGRLADVWVAESPTEDARNVQSDETLEFRYWSGQLWTYPQTIDVIESMQAGDAE